LVKPATSTNVVAGEQQTSTLHLQLQHHACAQLASTAQQLQQHHSAACRLPTDELRGMLSAANLVATSAQLESTAITTTSRRFKLPLLALLDFTARQEPVHRNRCAQKVRGVPRRS